MLCLCLNALPIKSLVSDIHASEHFKIKLALQINLIISGKLIWLSLPEHFLLLVLIPLVSHRDLIVPY